MKLDDDFVDCKKKKRNSYKNQPIEKILLLRSKMKRYYENNKDKIRNKQQSYYKQKNKNIYIKNDSYISSSDDSDDGNLLIF